MIFVKVPRLLFSFFLFSTSLFGMQSTSRDIILRASHQKGMLKSKFHCPCIFCFKKNAADDKSTAYYVTDQSAAIKKAVRIVGFSSGLVKNKNQLLKKGKWPKVEGAALKNELKLKKYCSKFAYCADKCDTQFMICSWGVIFGLFFIGGSVPFCISGGILVGSIVAGNRVNNKIEILEYMAQRNLRHLRPKYNNFRRAQQKLFDELAEKELKKINRE